MNPYQQKKISKGLRSSASGSDLQYDIKRKGFYAKNCFAITPRKTISITKSMVLVVMIYMIQILQERRSGDT